MEEKIYERQVNKQGLANRVIDTEQPDRMFSAEDLEKLYIYDVRGSVLGLFFPLPLIYQ